MKKIILSSALIASMFLAGFAQTESTNSTLVSNKKGLTILPEAGDIAIGVNAAPFITLAGNISSINNGGATYNANFNFVNGNNTIYAKYFLDENTAIRGHVRFDMTSTTTKGYITDDVKLAASNAIVAAGGVATFDPLVDFVEDKKVTSNSKIYLGAGIEKRRGHNRLQGYYGAEGLITMGGSTNNKYTYGNEILITNTDPTNNFGMPATRTLKSSTGSTFGLGARGFIGVEYFFAPKISVGGELGLGFIFEVTGEGKATTERWKPNAAAPTTGEVVTEEAVTAGNSQFTFDTDNNKLVNGSVFLLFHF